MSLRRSRRRSACAAPRRPQPDSFEITMREALILRASPERGLAEPRVADDGARAVASITWSVCEVVERAAQAPRPRANRAPLAVGRTRLPGCVEQRVHAVLEPVVEIGIESRRSRRWRARSRARRGGRSGKREASVPRACVGGAVIDDARVVDRGATTWRALMAGSRGDRPGCPGS